MFSPSFPEIHLPHLASVPLPPVVRVRLSHSVQDPLADLDGAVDQALGRAERLAALPVGSRSRWVAAALPRSKGSWRAPSPT